MLKVLESQPYVSCIIFFKTHNEATCSFFIVFIGLVAAPIMSNAALAHNAKAIVVMLIKELHDFYQKCKRT